MQPEPAPSRPLRARPRIGRYVVMGRIGRGGMGMVYRGLDEALEREVAVKTLTVEGSLDAESRRRFEVEAKAAAKLAHPNIVTVYELGEDRGVPFIAMEMLPGADLEALLRSGEDVPLEEKLDIVAQVCRGLAFAHQRGIVHRDIKPSNVRLLEDGTAKIMDFGIAKLGETQLTRTGMMVGTVNYMSPEQVRGQTLDGRSDVFSLGVILYEMLAGERPFRGEGATQVLYKIVHEEPPPPDLAAHGELAPRLRAILDRALAKDREARYPTTLALAEDLQAVLLARRAEAPPPAAVEAVAAARAALREGRGEDAVARLRRLVAEQPRFLDARRALRTALREQKNRAQPPPPGAEAYPELEATFQAAPTRREPGTEVVPTVTVTSVAATVAGEGPAPAAEVLRARRPWLWAASGLVLVAAAAAVVLLRGPAPPSEARIPVRSQPVGATVLVDGRDSGVLTNGELVLPAPPPAQAVLTFRMAGHRDETRTVRLPLAAGEAVSVTLQSEGSALAVRTRPPGASVTVDGARVAGVTPLDLALDPSSEHRILLSLDGHEPREVRLAAGERPAPLDLELTKLAPPGQVAVSSTYPLDVLWRGRPLARGTLSPRVELTGGRQVLTLVAPSVFLRADVSVEVPPGGATSLEAPELGRLNVRAMPDNCEVFIDGAFVDYPPILDRPVAAGRHTVGFRWPDGTRSEETIEVRRGAPTFVSGRKD